MRIRQLDLTFTALLLPLDALALFAAAISAYMLRFSRYVTEVLPILQNVPFRDYLSTASLFVIVWMVFFALAGMYHITPRKAWNELGRIILSCSAGTMLVIATVFFRREITTSRFIILAVLGFSILYVWLGRLFLRVLRHSLLQAGIGHRSFVLIGSTQATQRLYDTYTSRPILGISISLRCEQWNEKTRKAIMKLKGADGLDGILLADPDVEKKTALEIVGFAEEQHLTFTYLADLFAAHFTNITVSTETGVPIIEVKRTPLDGWGRIAKRAFDIIVSLILLIIVSPVLLLTLLISAIEDGFPIIFENIRVGERGELFKLHKIRSMWRIYCIGPQFEKTKEKNLELEQKLIKQRSLKEGPVYKIINDPRVTPVGNFLRRWSIDELPQLWNVLMGDMSLVGPRPHQPREVERYEPHHRRVLAIRPGITGMAQISGRSDLSFDDETRLDIWYIENWSPLLDLYIILKTPFVVLNRKGAY